MTTAPSAKSIAAGEASDLAAAAVDYARRGRAVFPVQPFGKRPLTAHGVPDATTNVALIRPWWLRRPVPNIGMVMGAASGLVALDVDGDEGHAALRELERHHGALPRTWSQTTPRG